MRNKGIVCVCDYKDSGFTPILWAAVLAISPNQSFPGAPLWAALDSCSSISFLYGFFWGSCFFLFGLWGFFWMWDFPVCLFGGFLFVCWFVYLILRTLHMFRVFPLVEFENEPTPDCVVSVLIYSSLQENILHYRNWLFSGNAVTGIVKVFLRIVTVGKLELMWKELSLPSIWKFTSPRLSSAVQMLV